VTAGGPAAERLDAAWAAVVGQARPVAVLRSAARRPVHAYLLVGPTGVGTRAAARAFAAEVLAAAAPPGGEERAVALALAETHPDLVVVERQGARISADEAREVVALSARSPVEGARKVILVVDVHLVDVFAAILLKAVEEPPPSTVFVLLAEEVPPELVTIASRSVRVDFGPVAPGLVAAALAAEGVDREAAEVAAAAAGGDLDRARLLATDPELAARRHAWWTVPERLDGTGRAVAELAAELRALIDRATEPLEARQAAEVAELAEQAARYGTRPPSARDLEARHRREVRRLRTDEVRAGLGVVGERYRRALVDAARPAPLVEAVERLEATAAALIRNPSEGLLLEALLLDLPPLAGTPVG
jgi:DNA polymerase-3 subunit delta'